MIFNELTEYVIQTENGYEIKQLDQTDEPMVEHIPIDEPAPMTPPTELERIALIEQAMLEMIGVVI